MMADDRFKKCLKKNKRIQHQSAHSLIMSDDEDDGQEIRDFSFVFETHCEITKAWKKEVGSNNIDAG